MSVRTGIIRDGQLVLRGEASPLPEGRRFDVLIDDDEEGLRLDQASVELLLESQAKIRRGDFVTAEEAMTEFDGG